MIEVDIVECLEEGITPSQYCYLKLLWTGSIELARDLYYNDPGLQKNMDQLFKLGYILFHSKDSGYSIDKKKCDELFKMNRSKFWELFTTYPIKVPDGSGGSRVLRARHPESKDAQTACEKYEKAVKSTALHNRVIKCLEVELENRKKSNSMKYMQNLITWINQRTWEKYEALLEEEKPKSVDYGQDLI